MKIKYISSYITSTETGHKALNLAYIEYDELGNPIIEESYDNYGNVAQRIDKEYDESGKITEETLYTESEFPDQITKYFYNNSGKLEYTKTAYSDGEFSLVTYYDYGNNHDISKKTKDLDTNEEELIYHRYDSKGRLLEEKVIGSNNKLIVHKINEIDEHGLLLNSFYQDERKTQKLVYSYQHDEDGRICSAKVVDDKGKNIRVDDYYYNQSGDVIENSYKDYIREIERIELFEYDEKGNIIKHEILNADESPIQVQSTKFNEHGDTIEQETRNNEGVSIISYEYAYWE